MNILLNILINVFRVIVGVTFILSGYVKAVDPLGTQYKINDYAEALGLGAMIPEWVMLCASVILSSMEFIFGIMLLFAIRRRLITRLVLLFSIVMTLVTVWIYVADPVSDCGCFGDAVKLTNGETLLKNIALLVMTATLAWRPLSMPRMVGRGNQWIVNHYSVIYIFATSSYCLYYLPIFDFRPYHVGADLVKGMEIPEDAEQPEFVTTFIMEKNGVRKKFAIENYPDSTWTFIDSETTMLKQGYVPPIHDFSLMLLPQTQEGKIVDEEVEDITETVLADTNYTFLLVSPHLENADDATFGYINQIHEYAIDNGYNFYCLTASGRQAIEGWKEITGADYQFCNTDETTLKTIIRSNPGLLLIKDGVVLGKWSYHNLPIEIIDSGKLTPQSVIIQKENSTTTKIWGMLAYFFVPLLILAVADRTLMWSAWVKKKEAKHSDTLFKILKINQQNEKENCSRKLEDEQEPAGGRGSRKGIDRGSEEP